VVTSQPFCIFALHRYYNPILPAPSELRGLRKNAEKKHIAHPKTITFHERSRRFSRIDEFQEELLAGNDNEIKRL